MTARVSTVDALRGFSMLWIIGGSEALLALCELVAPARVRDALARQLQHVEWRGFHFYDLIFPLFVFVAGLSIPLAFDRKRASGHSRARLAVDGCVRAALLFALGLVRNGLLTQTDLNDVRIMGVLQRIGLAYLAAWLMYGALHERKRAGSYLWLTTGTLLVGYTLLLTVVHVPGVGAGVLEPGRNLSDWIDLQVFSGAQLYDETGDPEGLVSTLGAFATALIGVIAGRHLGAIPRTTGSALLLIVLGLGVATAGQSAGAFLPLVKRVWTPTFVLVSAGWSVFLLGLFFLVADVLKCAPRLVRFLTVIGSNAVLIYLAEGFIDSRPLGAALTGAVSSYSPWLAPLVAACTVLALKWAVLWLLDSRAMHLRLGLPARVHHARVRAQHDEPRARTAAELSA